MKPKWLLFLDQNVRFEVKEELLRQGYDTIHAVDVNLNRATDPEILDYAIRSGRILLTHDSDFGDLHVFPLPIQFPGVIRLKTKDSTPRNVIGLLERFFKNFSPEDLKNALVILTDKRIRIKR